MPLDYLLFTIDIEAAGFTAGSLLCALASACWALLYATVDTSICCCRDATAPYKASAHDAKQNAVPRH